MAGVLYIVATPIGNLEDISLRAIRILKQVDLIAAEDTRHTQVLLNHYGIHTPLTSYHEHNEKTKSQALLVQLIQGKTLALVSDAGTPAISDPGYRLVSEASGAGIPVVPIPGASALTAVLAASGLPTDRFVFEGFLPAKKKQRRERLRELSQESRTVVLFEAPHRLKQSLDDIYEILGDREIVVAREVSKVHEEFLRGEVSDIIGRVAGHDIRGELTLIIRGSREKAHVSEQQLRREIQKLKAEGVRVKEIAEILGEKYSLAKKQVYRLALGPDE
jgi:16S rRNA (cytidine1402-2'-O)-methyltransferase